MKIIIELPDNFLDAEQMDNLTFITRTVREQVKSSLVEAIIKQIGKLPRFKFSHKKLKAKVEEEIISQMASNAIIERSRQ